MKAQQPHKNKIQLVALATTAAPSQNITFWNIDGAAKHLFIAADCQKLTASPFFGLISK